ncbi:MAG TPA: hypothetical protein VGC36_04795 [Rhizomicrobium sp.]
MKSLLVAAALIVGMLGATAGSADARPRHHGHSWGHHERHCVAWGWRHHHRYCRRWGW